MARRQQAFNAIVEGTPQDQVAAKMGITTRQVRHLVNKVLATEKPDATPEQIARMRQLSEARIMASAQKVILAQKIQMKDLADPDPKVRHDAAMAIAGLHDRLINGEKAIAELFGLNQPIRIIEEQLRLEVRQISNKITIDWDPETLKDDGQPIPGLHIGEARALLRAAGENGDSDCAGNT